MSSVLERFPALILVEQNIVRPPRIETIKTQKETKRKQCVQIMTVSSWVTGFCILMLNFSVRSSEQTVVYYKQNKTMQASNGLKALRARESKTRGSS